jgi:hypothetical protein
LIVFATAHTKIKGSASEAASDDEGLSSFISEPTAAGFQVLRCYNCIQRSLNPLCFLFQVVGQFRRLIKQMQEVVNEFPVVISAASSLESGTFDRVLRLIQSSAIGAIVILALVVPILWFQIFQNWRKQIMGMRAGRSALGSGFMVFWMFTLTLCSHQVLL